VSKQNSLSRFNTQVMVRVRTILGRLLFNGHPGSVYGIGLLNGVLPCGMVYLALAGAVAAGTAWKGSLFMASFGLGTLPAMAAVGYFGAWLTPSLRNSARKLFPAMMVLMATLLIIRGLNLGIPYLSPSLNISSSGAIQCHD
jgi:sulfite exporter TauE/SafE